MIFKWVSFDDFHSMLLQELNNYKLNTFGLIEPVINFAVLFKYCEMLKICFENLNFWFDYSSGGHTFCVAGRKNAS